jgi:hypothetical protein
MLSLQHLARIAARYYTPMADAMITACAAKAVETGETLVVPERVQAQAARGMRPSEDVGWAWTVEGNSDTPALHM